MMRVAKSQPQAGMARRLADHRAAVRQRRAAAEPGPRVQPLAQVDGLARPGFRQVQLDGTGRRVAVVQLDAGGQPQTARHRRQHVAAAGVVDGAAQRRAAGGAVMHVIAALERQRQVDAGGLEQGLGPRAQRHHQVGRRQRFRAGVALHDPATSAIAADGGGPQCAEDAARALEQVGVGRGHGAGIVHRIGTLDPQRAREDRRQGRLQLRQFGRGQRLGRHLVAGVGLARQGAALPRLFAAEQEDPAAVAQALARAGRLQQAQVFDGGAPDQAVERRRGFAEHRRPGARQEARRPAQVAGQVRGAVAELDGVVAQQPGQLAPQAGMVEGHEGAAGQDAGVAG